MPCPISLTIISGGQTGVDRGALDAALELGLPHGGWCPHGRLAEDGRIPDQYRLRETASTEYPVRTELNVRQSDATLVLFRGRPSGGTELTLRLAERFGMPAAAIDLDGEADPAAVRRWLAERNVATLNVAGPRESQCPGIQAMTREFLIRVIAGA